MRVLKEARNEAQICDSMSEEVKKLQLIFTFLSQISEVCHQDGVQFIGNWNIEYFHASLGTLGQTIENIKEIIE